MKNHFRILLSLFLLTSTVQNVNAQIDLQCNGRDMHSIYLVNTAGFYRMDSVDTNPTDPILLAANPFGSASVADGISINNNLDSTAGPVTMYYVNNNTPYHFWNGTGWTNTTHTAGSVYAVNPGASSGAIYNLDGFSGSIYKYDGSGTGVPFVTNLGANLLTVYDIAADSAGNFYLFYTGTNRIIVYNPAGIAIDSFNTTGFTNLYECGLAILGDRIYATTCTNVYGLYEGIKSGNTINFTMIKALADFYVDIAACPNAGAPLAVFKDPELPHFAIYPNPAKDVTNFKLHNTNSLQITNSLGQLVRAIPVTGLTNYQLSVYNWKPGVYFVKATSGSKTNSFGTLVVH